MRCMFEKKINYKVNLYYLKNLINGELRIEDEVVKFASIKINLFPGFFDSDFLKLEIKLDKGFLSNVYLLIY